MSEFMIKLAEIVGLEDKENATEDQIVQSFVALSEDKATIEKRIEELTADLEEQKKQTAPKEDEKIVKEKELVALNDQIVTLTEKAKAGETAMQKLTEMERDRVVGDAVREGKLIPALKEWAEDLYMSDPDKLRKYIEGAPVVLDEEVRGTSAEAPEKSAEMRLSEKAHEIKVSKDIPFRDALEQARTENPDLAEEYEKEKSERK